MPRAAESLLSFSVYVALTNIPVGELLTGFAMRSDPNVVFREAFKQKSKKSFVSLHGYERTFI